MPSFAPRIPRVVVPLNRNPGGDGESGQRFALVDTGAPHGVCPRGKHKLLFETVGEMQGDGRGRGRFDGRPVTSERDVRFLPVVRRQWR